MYQNFEKSKIIWQLLMDLKIKKWNVVIETWTVENIQELLIDLDLGVNPELEERVHTLKYETEDTWIISELLPETQAKTLSDKWFALQEDGSEATPSLWSTNPEQVLDELILILESLVKVDLGLTI